jgi:hypothetical protein
MLNAAGEPEKSKSQAGLERLLPPDEVAKNSGQIVPARTKQISGKVDAASCRRLRPACLAPLAA